MKLSFYAKGDLLVMHPVARHITGQAAAYIGRVFVPAKKAAKATKTTKGAPAVPASYPASEQPFECDSDSKEGRRLTKLCRRDGSLWPADEQTAAHCGVKFVPVEHADGEWVATKPDAARKSNKRSGPKE